MAETTPVHFFDLCFDQPGGLTLNGTNPRQTHEPNPLHSGTAKSWSLNTLQTRAVLDFKGIPYTQSWTFTQTSSLLFLALAFHLMNKADHTPYQQSSTVPSLPTPVESPWTPR